MIKVKEAIKASGLKQKSIANRLGISETYLSLLLKGDYDMSDDIKQRIMSLCNAVSAIQWFFLPLYLNKYLQWAL